MPNFSGMKTIAALETLINEKLAEKLKELDAKNGAPVGSAHIKLEFVLPESAAKKPFPSRNSTCIRLQLRHGMKGSQSEFLRPLLENLNVAGGI